jgi:hypothetical protein
VRLCVDLAFHEALLQFSQKQQSAQQQWHKIFKEKERKTGKRWKHNQVDHKNNLLLFESSDFLI